MRAIYLAIAAGCFSLCFHGSARSQAPVDASATSFVRDYKAKLPLLLERYSTNRKIRSRYIHYATDPVSGEYNGSERSNVVNELITDGVQIKVITPEGKPDKFKDTVQFWRPDMRFNVTRKGTKFEITEQLLANSNYYSHEVSRNNFRAQEPLRAGSGGATTAWFDERGHTSTVVTVVEARPATWAGRACIEVRTKWDNTHVIVTLASTYVDPAMDYATIATETDWNTSPPRGGNRLLLEFDYVPSAEGFPLPKRTRATIKYKDGTSVKAYDVEFLSYERYVPTADDFKLEKEYGLVTPAFVPTATSIGLAPAGRRWWPWAVLAVGAVLGVVAVAVARRSRRRVAAPLAGTPGSPVKTPSR